jgi:hypothetical protein
MSILETFIPKMSYIIINRALFIYYLVFIKKELA